MKLADFEMILDSAIEHSKDNNFEQAETLCNALLMIKESIPSKYQAVLVSVLLNSNHWFPEEQFYERFGYDNKIIIN